MDRDSPRLVLAGDALFAFALCLALTYLGLNASTTMRGRDLAVLTAALCAPLALRRTAPRVSVLGVAAVALFQLTLDGPPIVLGDFAVHVAVYSAAVYTAWRFSIGALLGAVAGAVALAYLSVGPDVRVALPAALFASTAVAAWAIGAVRRLVLDRQRSRAAYQAERMRLVEEGAEQKVALALADERARIAREMHDVVAHSLAVVVAQADGGRYAAKASPDAGIAALETIATTSRTALAEMRRLLAVLREDSPAAGPDAGPSAAQAPQPDLSQVPALVEQVAAGGLPVSLEVTGTPRDLPAGTQLTAYRVVQEGLTNVLKHGGPAARAAVRLNWLTEGRLVVEVFDDGRGAGAAPPSPGSGLGLIGMRERVVLAGGTLTAGPLPGGFTVRAELPVD